MIDIENDEFDIQKTILVKKKTKNIVFYVEYSKVTQQIISISKNKILATSFLHDVVEVPHSDIIDKIFKNTINLNHVIVNVDENSNHYLSIKQQKSNRSKQEFITSVNPLNSLDNYLYFNFDLIAKYVTVKFDHQKFLHAFSFDKINELSLALLPNNITIYFMHKHDPSNLFGKLNLDINILFSEYELRIKCPWLQDNEDFIENLDCVHSNHNINFSMKKSIIESGTRFKPMIVYKQIKNKLAIQSIISDVNSFKLENIISFYLYDTTDPSQLIDTIRVNTTDLNNYNLLEFKLSTTKPIKIMTNYSHLFIEDSNVSTYYRF